VKVVKLPPPLVGAPKTAVQVFLFFYAHEGEDWSITAIAKAIGTSRPNTQNTITKMRKSGLIARKKKTVLLGKKLKEETFWVSVPEPLIGRKLGLIQVYGWLLRLAESESTPFDIKLESLGAEFGHSRQRAGQCLSDLNRFGLIEYESHVGYGKGITVLSVG
jgi:DNA-binding IclR family transcriptional regulator